MKTCILGCTLLLGSLLGCQNFPLGSLIEVQPDACVSVGDQTVNFLHTGAHLWDGFGGRFRLADELQGQTPDQILPIGCMSGQDFTELQVTAPPHTETVGYYDEEKGKVFLDDKMWQYVPPGTPQEIKDYRYVEKQAISEVVAHELGHSMGMVHELDPTAVMFWTVEKANFPNATDAGQLCQLYPGSPACKTTIWSFPAGLWPDADPNHS